MENTLHERLIILVGEQVEKAKTENEKAEYIQLLNELQKEGESESSQISDNIFWSLIKNIATHEAISIIKDILSG